MATVFCPLIWLGSSDAQTFCVLSNTVKILWSLKLLQRPKMMCYQI